ncbi:hypothetical protein DB30_01539 [Enhygromyxa salina]|uniref:CHAT domain-containing protein n=1 Tax=Enhygromyxa salina TaxID=215803 RepID=A0A0C2CRW1_9BACT|nr:CHAT domain-containing protein [Enhygromyxa salina]KIG12380.1 hypothetical protein DB30_01539 [Enhygromyxa salina]
MGSSPDGEPPVAASREYQAIDDTFGRRAGLVAQYRPQSSIEDLRKQILLHRPIIVHFIGHGTPDGELVFVHDDESPQLPPHEAAARAFATRDTVKCVVLNACHSLAQARVIAQRVSVVIGVRGDHDEWHDEAALAFTRAFYLGINEELSAHRAFELGRDALVDLDVDPELGLLVPAEGTSAADIFLHSPPVPGIVDAAVADLDDVATARLLSIAAEGLRALFRQANTARQEGEFGRAHGLFRDAHAQALKLAETEDDEADEFEALLGLTQLAYAVSLLHVGEEAKAIDQLIVLAKRVLGSTPSPDLAWRHRLVETLFDVRQPALAAAIMARWSSVPRAIAAMLAVERGEILSRPGPDATPRLRAHMALHHDRVGDVDTSAELALALLDDDEMELEVLANAVLVLGRAIVQTALDSPELHRPLAPERRLQAVLRFSAGLATARARIPEMAPATRTTLNEIAAEVQRHTFDAHGLIRSLRALGQDVEPREVGIALAHEGTVWSAQFRAHSTRKPRAKRTRPSSSGSLSLDVCIRPCPWSSGSWAGS